MSPTEPYPSIHEAYPQETGGPSARRGFEYQDHVGVSLLLELLETDDATELHLETHDDFVLIYQISDASTPVTEYIQIKSDKKESLWSVPDITRPTKPGAGNSILERQLNLDRLAENSHFRIITYRDAHPRLRPLTEPRDSDARTTDHPDFSTLVAEIDNRLPNVTSPKGATTKFWAKNCLWQIPGTVSNILSSNINRLNRMAESFNFPVPIDYAEKIIHRMLSIVYHRSNLDPKYHRAEKIITKTYLHSWLENELSKYKSEQNTAGKNLTRKLEEISAPCDIIKSALEYRRSYSHEVRTPRYFTSNQVDIIYDHVQDSLYDLRCQQVAGSLTEDGLAFHNLCVKSAKASIPIDIKNTSHSRNIAIGALYDITDRCLHKYRSK